MSRIELCDVCKHLVSTKHESLIAFPPVRNISWALIINFAQWLVFPQISVAVCCSWCCFWRVKLQLSQEIMPIAPQSVLQPQSIVTTSTTVSMQGRTRRLKLSFKKWRHNLLTLKMASTFSKETKLRRKVSTGQVWWCFTGEVLLSGEACGGLKFYNWLP